MIAIAIYDKNNNTNTVLSASTIENLIVPVRAFLLRDVPVSAHGMRNSINNCKSISCFMLMFADRYVFSSYTLVK